MAKATWAQVSPMSGTGNDILAFSAPEHTGRSVRTTVAIVATTTEPAISRQVSVQQAALAEFVSGSASYNVSAATKKITITGESNAAKLNFTTTSSNLSIPTTYTANGASATNNTAIPNDPGSTAKYAWSIEVTIPENLTIQQKSFAMTVTTGSGKTLTISIVQQAAPANINLVAESVTVDDTGTTVTVNLTSNADWRII